VEAIVPNAVSTRSETAVMLEYKGARSKTVEVPVIASLPALFSRDASGKGQAAMLNQTGCCNSPRDPPMVGSIATLFATGVTVGNMPAEVLYRNNVGMLVANFRVPVNAPAGDSIPLILTVGESRSVDGITMAIQSARHGVLIIGRDPCSPLSPEFSNVQAMKSSPHASTPEMRRVIS
jgi:hypothetical protein